MKGASSRMIDITKLLDIPPDGAEPPMNAALEDVLAMSGADAASREVTLLAWVTLGVEYLARERGRRRTRDMLAELDVFVRDARPATPWPK